MPSSLSSNTGFTLIEVLAAVVIMMIGLLGLLQSINVALVHDIRNQLRDEAILIGEEQMNNLRLGYTFSGVTTIPRIIRGAGREFKVVKESVPLEDLKKLNISVKWCYQNTSATHYLHTVSR